MNLIDVHAHLTNPQMKPLMPAVLERSRQAGVTQWIAIGTDIPDSAEVAELSRNFPGVYHTVGIHPHEAGSQESGWMTFLGEMAKGDKCVGIGETGLDYYYDLSPRLVQQIVFQEQLRLARELNKPVVIHCREAMDDCVGILQEWNYSGVPVIFHCYAGNRAQARVLLDRGCYLSFTGMVTFKNAEETRQTVIYAPLDRILVETDCPYLSPEPKRNTKPNEPALLVHTAAKVAELKNLDIETMASILGVNSRAVFKIEQTL